MKIKNKDSVFTMSNLSSAYDSTFYQYQGWLVLFAIEVMIHNLKTTSPNESSMFAVFTRIFISTTVLYAVFSFFRTAIISIRFAHDAKRDNKSEMGISYEDSLKENNESNTNNESNWC